MASNYSPNHHGYTQHPFRSSSEPVKLRSRSQGDISEMLFQPNYGYTQYQYYPTVGVPVNMPGMAYSMPGTPMMMAPTPPMHSPAFFTPHYQPVNTIPRSPSTPYGVSRNNVSTKKAETKPEVKPDVPGPARYRGRHHRSVSTPVSTEMTIPVLPVVPNGPNPNQIRTVLQYTPSVTSSRESSTDSDSLRSHTISSASSSIQEEDHSPFKVRKEQVSDLKRLNAIQRKSDQKESQVISPQNHQQRLQNAKRVIPESVTEEVFEKEVGPELVIPSDLRRVDKPVIKPTIKPVTAPRSISKQNMEARASNLEIKTPVNETVPVTKDPEAKEAIAKAPIETEVKAPVKAPVETHVKAPVQAPVKKKEPLEVPIIPMAPPPAATSSISTELKSPEPRSPDLSVPFKPETKSTLGFKLKNVFKRSKKVDSDQQSIRSSKSTQSTFSVRSVASVRSFFSRKKSAPTTAPHRRSESVQLSQSPMISRNTVPRPPSPALRSAPQFDAPKVNRVTVTPPTPTKSPSAPALTLRTSKDSLSPPTNLSAGDISPRALTEGDVETIVCTLSRTNSITSNHEASTHRRMSEDHVPNATVVEAPSKPQKEDPKLLISAMKSDKKNKVRKRSGATSTPSVSFVSQVLIYRTFSPEEYDRTPDWMTSDIIREPGIAQKLREELNTWKSQMDVHPNSVQNTQFFQVRP